MGKKTIRFLGEDAEAVSPESARFIVLPFPYEGGVSYGSGTMLAPQAILDASAYLELYDEILEFEPFRAGIATVEAPEIPDNPEDIFSAMYEATGRYLENNASIIVLGGDHSITSGHVKALLEKYGTLSVIQFDAHADLRDDYNGSKLSHACVMSRIREYTRHTLQIGIRSMSKPEAERAQKEHLQLCTLHALRSGIFDVQKAVDGLPDPVFITFDVDVFDWSVVNSTGTPEPGGMLWDEALKILQIIFSKKNVIGFDIVELSCNAHDKNSPFAIAKLIYKMIAFKQLPGIER
jgi:agmatinase